MLNKGGVFISIAASNDTYNYDWLTLNTNFPENTNKVIDNYRSGIINDIQVSSFLDIKYSQLPGIESKISTTGFLLLVCFIPFLFIIFIGIRVLNS